jgi:hypothetical protein
MTWADDGHLYTAYGDGYGFDPIVPEKLGMGFVRVVGDAADFRGENIRSDAENSGMGRKGRKASGMLMVDGVLYLLVRNADNDGHLSQLAWSTDRARTWTWADWRFEEFGHPTFVNYGRNYAGSRDNYVYVLSHDNPSAYEPADHFVLMRVPKAKLRERKAYEFYAGMQGNDPTWSQRTADRKPVFTNPRRCCRSSVSFDAPLRRYLWWQGSYTGDTRFEGGFGVYDAPEPWGPWTTVYQTERWDVGPGELGCFPTKWISGDGRTLHLVFSGNDNFSVREVTLTVNQQETQGSTDG